MKSRSEKEDKALCSPWERHASWIIPLVALIASGIMSYGVTQGKLGELTTRIAQAEERQTHIEDAFENLKTILTEVRVNVASTKSSVEAWNKQLDRIEARLNALKP